MPDATLDDSQNYSHLLHRFLGLLPGTPAEVHCARVAQGVQQFSVPGCERTMCLLSGLCCGFGGSVSCC